MAKAKCDASGERSRTIRVGTFGRYSGCYSKSMLANWAKWLKDQAKDVRGIYVYFNNDACAYAVNNAKQLIEQLY